MKKIIISTKGENMKFTRIKEQVTPKQTHPKYGYYRTPTSTTHRKNEELRSLYFGKEGTDYFYIY